MSLAAEPEVRGQWTTWRQGNFITITCENRNNIGVWHMTVIYHELENMNP